MTPTDDAALRLARRPEAAESLTERGHALRRAGDGAGAEALWREALAASPDHAPAHMALVQSCYERGDWPAYLAEVDRFEALHPGEPFLTYERGYLDLLQGRMGEAWRRWDARLAHPGYIPADRRFPQPRWQGELFQGKTLLVTYEQGFGDTFMLARYLPLVKARGGRVLFLVQPQVAYLMTTLRGVDEVVPLGQPLPPFDLQAATFSLPALFGTTLETVPAEIPYLDVPPAIPSREALAEALAPSQGKVRIGLAWAGNPAHPRDAQRSIAPEAFGLLAGLDGVAWHSLQLGQTAPPPLPGLTDLAPLLRTFSDTAYALSGMDLVITVDTALAHLAGALGVPVLLLLTYAPDPRWMLDRDDSPWYPSFRLYRQPRPGDWTPVLEHLAADLAGGPAA